MTSSVTNQELDVVKDVLLRSGIAPDLSEEELTELAEIGIKLCFKKGDTVISEDSTSRDLYVISEGYVSIRLMLPSVYFEEEVIKKMTAPDIFGEFSLANGEPRSATVKAEGNLVTFQFEYESLVELMERNTRIGYVLMRNMAGIIANRVRENHKCNRKLMFGL
ncbi:MAG: cyclic nucleotide-binding domain-containing protein [Calditrichaeota bacterium]|nr:cyclic nucleotide-binding domain-containing protein [Calditrichota bacterium]